MIALIHLAAPLFATALQAAPPDAGAPSDPPPPATLASLAEGERAALRCGVAFAVVHGWQVDDDPRGAAFPVMENTGGREFFVRTTAQLMDERGLDRAGVLDLVAEQAQAFTRDASEVEAIMPACLMMKRAAGL